MTQLLPHTIALSLALIFCPAAHAQSTSAQTTPSQPSAAAGTALPPYQYHLTFSATDRRLVQVEANVTLKGGALLMASAMPVLMN